MTIAFLCSGQGRQAPGMFDLVAGEAAVAPILAEAEALLGASPLAVAAAADPDLLQANRTSQILCVTRALALGRLLLPEPPQPLLLAGYSVGEMAAWGLAAVWSPAETLRLTARRAELMDQAGGPDDGLGFIRGLSHRQVVALAARFDCAISIINPDLLFIVGGAKAGLADLCAAALAQGAAHAGLIAVHVASHTPRLRSAVAPFAAALKATAPASLLPGRVLLSAADAGVIFAPARGLDALAQQIARPIDWAATVTALVERGATAMLELGPGTALADMLRTACPGIPVRAADDFKSLDGLRRWIADVGMG